MSDLTTKIIHIVATELQLDETPELDGESVLVDIGVDSPTLLEIAIAIETEFDKLVPDRVLAKFKTVSDIVTYVEKGGG